MIISCELENINFDLPTINFFNIERDCIKALNGYDTLQKMINKNQTWINRVFQFVGYTLSPKIWVDFLYIPNSIMIKLCDIVEQMYKDRIFLEISIPTSFALLSLNEYQIINSIFIWTEKKRKNVIKILKKSYNYACIHPIKFSNLESREEINSYSYFMNALEF